MTRNIDETLLTAQKKTAYQPSLQATFSDNKLPHPVEQIAYPMTGFSANSTASCVVPPAGGSEGVFVRAHRTPSDGISIQRITDPSVSSSWTTGWTQLSADGCFPSLFYTGVYVVCVYQDITSKAVKWKRSADGGSTWSSEQTIWTPSFYFNDIQVGTGGDPNRSGFFYADGTKLCFRLYDPMSDSFGAEVSTDLGRLVMGIGACYAGSDVWRVAYIIEDYADWTDSAIFLTTLTSPSTWGSSTLYVGIQGGTGETPAYSYHHVNLTRIENNYWLSFYLSADTYYGALFEDGDQLVAFSDDGIYFTGGVKLQQKNLIDRLQPLQWEEDVYLASDTVLLKSSPPASVTLSVDSILHYDLEDHGAYAYLEMTLDNRDGSLDSLRIGRLGCDLTLERGAALDGVAYRVARETFVVDRIRRSTDGKQIYVHAYNYYRLLYLWQADFTYYYTNQTLATLIERIAGLAGIHSVTNDSDSVFSTPVGQFTISPGQSAGQALASLMEQYQFVCRMSAGTNLHAMVLSPSPTADYVFGPGAGKHPTLRVEDNAERSLPDITHAQVVGATAAAEKIAADLQAESGRQFTYRVDRTYVSSVAQASAAATAIIDKVTASVSRAHLVSLPVFHLQVLDAVSSDDWSTGQVRYIAGMRETYNPMRKETHRVRRQAWRMTLTLAELAKASADSSSIDLVSPEIPARSAFRRGNVISFDPSTWKAIVRVDGSLSAFPLPVAEYVSPANLVAGRRCAVLLFDESNPDDGLVIGTFGTATWRQVDRLYAADGNPGPALEMDADGNAVLVAGCDVRPDGDQRGLAARFLVPWTYSVTDHFRDGSIPAGYAWQNASPFSGTPSPCIYAHKGDYLVARPTGTGYKHFLSTSITNSAAAWYNTGIIGRFGNTGTIGVEGGLRVDVGNDSEYMEVYVTNAPSNGTSRVDVRYRVGGGGVATISSSLIVPAGTFVILRLACIYSGGLYRFYAQAINETANAYTLATAGSLTSVPAAGRAGILIANAVSNYPLCDWFVSDFG